MTGKAFRIKFCFCCNNCSQWTHVAMDVSAGTEVHVGCASCGEDIVMFKAIEGIEE